MIVMAFMVSALRAKLNVSILHGDNIELALRMRRHGNLVENAPMALILMGIVGSQGAGTTWLIITGILLLAGRLVHPFGINATTVNSPLRGLGVAGTSLSMLLSIGFILWAALGG